MKEEIIETEQILNITFHYHYKSCVLTYKTC